MCKIQKREMFFCGDAVPIPLPFLSNEHNAVDSIVDMRECSQLRPRFPHRKRRTREVLLFECLDDRAVPIDTSALPRAIHIIEIGYRIRQVIPSCIIMHELAVRGLHPGIRSEIAAESSVRTRADHLGRRTGIHEFAFLLAPKLQYAKGASNIQVEDEIGFFKTFSNARILAEMVDKVGSFRNMFLDIFRMTLAVVDAGGVVLAAPCEIIIQRDDRGPVGKKTLAEMRADKTRAAGNKNEFLI